MQKLTRQKITGLFLALVIVLLFGTMAQKVLTIPSRQMIAAGEPLKLDLLFPKHVLNNLEIDVHSEDLGKIHYKGNYLVDSGLLLNQTSSALSTSGEFLLNFKLFGMIPLCKMVVDVVSPVNVIPGGHSIGVLLHSQGVIVVGKSAVTDEKGNKYNPAQDAGITVGDIIQKVNHNQVKTDVQMRDEIEKAGKSGQKIVMEIKRDGKTFNTTVNPVYCHETQHYRIGLFIRDSAAGVGTLTFCEPKSKKYGALGHVITDIDTSQKIDLADGKIVSATIENIRPGKKGQPGEKIGVFKGHSDLVGNIIQNTQFGINGKLQNNISNPIYSEPLPAAMSCQVHEGPAKILTVLKNSEIESFDINIEQVTPQSRPEGKGLVVKITDKKLLEKTGGIIQGMSGSPIIQDNRFAGAITHVFVNDPTKGYGVLAEWMLKDAELIPDSSNEISKLKTG